MKRIDNLETKFCTGCATCSQICPVHAIEMLCNSEGFLYPKINSNLCINCGLCAKMCPALKTNNNDQKEEAKVFACWAKDEMRAKGSSGGIFACIAEFIIDHGGIVYGAAFENGCRKLRHVGVTSKGDLYKIYKSKYLQSEISNSYIEVKNYLEENKLVLFSGTPCQVDGLKSFLQKDYDNLYTIDILCHGVPSPMAYNKFLDEIANDKKIEKVDFRDKKYGWGTLLNVTLENGIVHYDYYNGNYFRAFLSGLSMRESCFTCKYSHPKRVGDITLGDFWGVSNYQKSLDDKKGTSLVLCNSIKGLNLFEKIIENWQKKVPVPYDKAIEISVKANAALVRPTWKPEMRKCFFKHLKNGDAFSKSLRYAEKAIMDIGLLGWWIETPRSNYGSTLTNFALYRYLSDEGYSVAFISPPGFDRKNAGKFNLDNRYRMTAKYSIDQMKENNKYIDTFIVGSDVLWYYDAFIKSGYMFLLDFVQDDKKKISYSTSFGNTKKFFPKNEMFKAKCLLERFDKIAVREFEAVDICKKKFDVEATQVLDPVFLCSLDSWFKLANSAERKTTGKYLFAYILDPDKEKVENILAFASKKKLTVVSITDKQFNPEQKMDVLNTCGVLKNASINEFIYHMINAEYVVTDSYHGLCFSLIFKKQFAVLVNKNRGASRFETLSKLFNIEQEMLEHISELNTTKCLHKIIDYDQLTPIIEKEIKRCQNWLIEAISSDKEIKKLPKTNEYIIKELAIIKEAVLSLYSRVAKLEKY